VRFAIAALERGTSVDEVVRSVGLSHRRMIELFREQVGLPPKTYSRVRRFQRALALVPTLRSWGDLALTVGYSDQSHLVREFGTLAGMTPGAYLAVARAHPNPRHLPLAR
jgi:transcriptional regulator GlxA family with amidase domain